MIDIRDAFFDEFYNIASKDSNIIFLTADMGALGLEKFKIDFPNRYINVGVAEQNLVNVAAGLALAGKRPFIYGIASFITQRCYEQIKVCIYDMNLPVTIIGSGPGLSYGADGPTHHLINDIAIMSVLPIIILTPTNVELARKAVQIAYSSQLPVYIRLAKDKMLQHYGRYIDYNKAPFMLYKGGLKI